MSLRNELLEKLGQKEEGFMLAELYGIFDVGALLDEVRVLEKEGKVELINKNRVRLKT